MAEAVADAPALSLAEWIVLTLVDEGPTYGFAVAALTDRHGDVGQAWHIPRPVVYRCLDRLVELGLARVDSTQAGHRGPRRSVVTSTPAGAAAVRAWLGRPVSHVRDIRSELLAKLALLARRGTDPDRLTAAQRGALVPVQAALEEQQRTATGFARVLAAWRVENVRATMRFLDALDAARR